MDSPLKHLCPWIFVAAVLAGTGTAAQAPDDRHTLEIETTFNEGVLEVVSLIAPEELGPPGSSIVLMKQDERRNTAHIRTSMALMELDPSGTPVWQSSIVACEGPPACPEWDTEPSRVARGRDGYMVVGTAGGIAGRHLFLAYFSLRGKLGWIKLFDSAGGQTAYGVDVVYLGDPRRPADPANPDEFMVLGSVSVPHPAEGEAWIFRVDTKGGVVGTGQKYLGQGYAEPRRLRKARGRGVFLVGSTLAAAGGAAPRRGWVLQLDPEGKAQWERFYSEGPSQPFELVDLAEGTKSLLAIGPTHVGSLEKTAVTGIPGEARWGLRAPAEIAPAAIDVRDLIILSARPADQPDAPPSTDLHIELSFFAVAGTFRPNRSYHYPWLAQINEDGRVLWQKRYTRDNGGFAVSVAFPTLEEILAGGSWGRAGSPGEKRGLFVSSRTRDRRSPEVCSAETTGVFSPVCLKSEVGPKSSEPLDMQPKEFAARWANEIRIRTLCPVDR